MMRENRIKQISYDWSDQLAIFLAAYPQRDPMTCTVAVFEYLVRRAPRVVAYLHGWYDKEMERKDTVDRMNREILLKERFNKTFPGMFREV